jgi:hypothetical protein
VLCEAWQQGVEGGLDITDRSNSHRMPAPDMRRIGINLNDSRAIRIELAPGEIRAEQKQHIAVEDGVIAGGPAKDAGHPDIVWVVVLDEVLSPRRVRHWRLQLRRRCDHFVVGACAAGARVNRNCLALVENGRDFVEVGVARANEREPRMNTIRKFVVRGNIGDIHRQDEDGDAPSRQRRLASCDGFAAGLLRRKDHLAEDTAASVHVDEVDLLDRFEAQVLAHDLACDQDDRGTVAIGFIEAVDEVEAAWSARARAGGEAAGELSFGARRRPSGLA